MSDIERDFDINDLGYLFLYWVNGSKDRSFAHFFGMDLLREFDSEYLYDEKSDLLVYNTILSKLSHQNTIGNV